MEKHLLLAEDAAERRRGPLRMISGASLEQAWSNVRAADLLLLNLVSDAELAGWSNEVFAMAERHLRPEDSRRVELTKRMGHIKSGRVESYDRALLIWVMDASYDALDAELARVRNLRNVLWIAFLCFLVWDAGIVILGWFWPEVIDLCFRSPSTPDGKICPAGNVGPSSKDIFAVEIAGLIGAALTVIVALRRIQGTRAPFGLPLAAAALKLPTGALTAFLGVVLIHGGFVRELIPIDNRGQLLAWAVIFGAAQHLVTRIVDAHAEEALADIGNLTEAERPGAARREAS
ncbi:hypothetical protein ACIF83_30040 [Streptomyces sp. NPDC085866]|uniref:hypothetical protein n=1 Tax=Streptomyces sp. NPDC085866 TaxID=3365736 RepID=UPI0037CDDF0A